MAAGNADRWCAEALTRGPGGLTPARDTHSCLRTSLVLAVCTVSRHNKRINCMADVDQGRYSYSINYKGAIATQTTYESHHGASGTLAKLFAGSYGALLAPYHHISINVPAQQ